MQSHFSRKIFGRPFEPLIMGVAMAMVSLAWFQLIDKTGLLAAVPFANIPALAAGACALILFVSWVLDKHSWMMVGLALALGVMVARTLFIASTADFYSLATFLTFSWTALVAAVWYEEAQPRVPKGSA